MTCIDISSLTQNALRELSKLNYDSLQQFVYGQFDDYLSMDELSQATFNYIDALFQRSPWEALIANLHLQKTYMAHATSINPESICHLHKEEALIRSVHQKQFSSLSHPYAHFYSLYSQPLGFTQIPQCQSHFEQALVAYLKNHQLFSITRSTLFKSFENSFKPLFPLKRNLPLGVFEKFKDSLKNSSNHFILCYITASDLPWEELESLLEFKERLFIFTSYAQWAHCLQFEALAHILLEPQTHLLILDHNLDLQLKAQPQINRFLNTSLITMSTCNEENSLLKRFQKMLQSYNEYQVYDHKSHETAFFLDQLKTFSNECSYFKNVTQYSLNYFINCYRIHESKSPDYRSLNYLENVKKNKEVFFKNHTPNIKSKVTEHSPSHKIKIAHIISSLHDYDSSNSFFSLNFLTSSLPSSFESYILCSDFYAYRYQEYPYEEGPPSQNPYKTWSKERNTEFQKKCEQAQIPIFFTDSESNYQQSLQTFIATCQNIGIDILVFHDHNLFHEMIAQSLQNTPSLLLNSENLLNPHSYTQDVSSLFLDLFPFINQTTTKTPLYLKRHLNLHHDAHIMISYYPNLEPHLSYSATHLIGTALREIPQLYSVILGGPKEKALYFQNFLDIQSKIYFLGTPRQPQRYFQEATLYLELSDKQNSSNLLNALGAQLPIVSLTQRTPNNDFIPNINVESFKTALKDIKEMTTNFDNWKEHKEKSIQRYRNLLSPQESLTKIQNMITDIVNKNTKRNSTPFSLAN